MTNSDFTEHNRVAWDARAKDYDSEEYMQKINSQIIEAITTRLDWIGAQWVSPSDSQSGSCSLLDYACGTGKITRALQPHITIAKGMDISEAMIEVYNSLATEAASNGAALRAEAILGDLVAKEATGPSIEHAEWRDFDIAAIGLGFHHFEEPERCLRRLVERVKKGTGVVLILDWLPSEDGHSHGEHEGNHSHHAHAHAHGHQYDHDSSKMKAPKGKEDEWQAMQKTIKHHGFSKETMKEMFEGAGLVDFGFEVLEDPFVLKPKGRTLVKKGFMARGRRV